MFFHSKLSLEGYNHNIDTKYMEHIMDLLELGAIAQIVGALTIFISVVLVIIELRKNLKQIILPIPFNVQSNGKK